MKTRFLLLALLLAPLLVAAQEPCGTVFPPDACDTAVSGVSPVPDPPLSTAVACWNLDEAANVTRVDSCGSADLTDASSNTGVVAGINNNGVVVNFGANNCLTNATPIPMGNEWTVNLWIDNLGDNSAALVNGQFQLRGALNAFFSVSNIFSISGQPAGTSCTPSTTIGGFHMFTAWLHPSDGKIHCAIDNGPEVVAGTAVVMPTISGALTVGNNGCSFGFGPSGTDELSFWDRALSYNQRQELLTTFAPF